MTNSVKKSKPPRERFEFCAAHALADRYLWVRTLNMCRTVEPFLAQSARDLAAAQPLHDIMQDAERFTAEFFRMARQAPFKGADLAKLMRPADDSTEEYETLCLLVREALQTVYWDELLQFHRFYDEDMTEAKLLPEFEQDAGRAADLLLRYLNGGLVPFTARDFNTAAAYYRNRRKKA